jgi:protein ImuB
MISSPVLTSHQPPATSHRIACLHVPDFALAALLRAQADLQGEPVVIVDGEGTRARIVCVSAAAARYGVRAGLSMVQAQAVYADIIVRPVSADIQRSAQAALCDVAESFSPRIEDAGSGVVYLDLDGLGALFETESKLANALARRTVQIGLEAQIGVAGSKVAAHLAARDGGGVAVIPPGEEWSFLAPVPVALLDPGRALAQTLQRWGIRTIGDLAALPATAVGTRLGPEGVRLVARARGEDEHGLQPRSMPLQFEESVDLDYGIEAIEPFLFVLRPLLERLLVRLEMRGLVCGDLRLSLGLATRGRDERTVVIAAPSNDLKSLLTHVRLSLEGQQPGAAVDSVRLAAVAERLRAAQLDLYRPSGPEPSKLALTLARLTAICGADRVGAPMVADDHRPEAYGLTAFQRVDDQSKATAPFETAAKGRGLLRASGESGLAMNSLPVRAEEVQGPSRSPGGFICRLSLRTLRPPRSVEVLCRRDRPDFVRGEDIAGRIVHLAGPWRIHGRWWSEERYARDYYDAQLSDGGVYRMFHDLRTGDWFVDGVYD